MGSLNWKEQIKWICIGAAIAAVAILIVQEAGELLTPDTTPDLDNGSQVQNVAASADTADDTRIDQQVAAVRHKLDELEAAQAIQANVQVVEETVADRLCTAVAQKWTKQQWSFYDLNDDEAETAFYQRLPDHLLADLSLLWLYSWPGTDKLHDWIAFTCY